MGAAQINGKIMLCIWLEKGRNIVGWLGSNSFNDDKTVSNKGALSFSFLTGPVVCLTDIRLRQLVMKDGKDGVVISRTKDWYACVSRNIRVRVIMHSFLLESGSGRYICPN